MSPWRSMATSKSLAEGVKPDTATGWVQPEPAGCRDAMIRPADFQITTALRPLTATWGTVARVAGRTAIWVHSRRRHQRARRPSPGSRSTSAASRPRWHHRSPLPPPAEALRSRRPATGPAVGSRQWMRRAPRMVARSPAWSPYPSTSPVLPRPAKRPTPARRYVGPTWLSLICARRAFRKGRRPERSMPVSLRPMDRHHKVPDLEARASARSATDPGAGQSQSR